MNWMNYLLGLTGVLGMVGLGAIAVFAPAVLGVAGELLKPIATAVGKVMGDLLTMLWDGMKNALDTLSAMLFVVVLVAGTYGYTNHFGPKRVAAETEVSKLVKQINGQKAKIDELRKLCGVPCRGK
jgi:hypothetical protein